MKIVHLVPSVELGGTEAVADALHAMARANGHASIVDLPFDRNEPAPKALSPYRWIVWALRARDADVFHAHLAWPDRLGAALLAARTAPLVVTFHLLPPDGAWPRDRVTGIEATAMLRTVAKRPRTRFVALSRDDRDRLRAYGIDAGIVRNAPPTPRPAGDPCVWPDGVVRFASIGRLHAQKGFDRMLRALAHTSLAARPWHWIVVGDGPERAPLEALRNSLGLREQVEFPGIRVPADVLAGAHALLAPSRSEGMPLVPLEALEARVPVLASEIPAHRELFEDAPDSLLPADDAQWPDALAAMLDAPRRGTLAAAQSAILGGDPRERCWRETLACYEAAR